MDAAHVAEQPPIELPPVGELSEAQMRGQQCVWCGVTPGFGQSIDLGSRDAGGRRVFPRGCGNCTRALAYRQLLTHSGSCEQCADDAHLCEISAQLRRILREARRA